jgi:acylphosphatase
MKRLTAYVVGQIYISSFQLRLYTSATRFGLKGCAEALDDGRIRIIAEGKEENYSDATGDFNDFETGYDWELHS